MICYGVPVEYTSIEQGKRDIFISLCLWKIGNGILRIDKFG